MVNALYQEQRVVLKMVSPAIAYPTIKVTFVRSVVMDSLEQTARVSDFCIRY